MFYVGGMVYIVSTLSNALTQFAGRTSFADLGFKLWGNLNAAWTISVPLNVVTSVLYLRERRNHQLTREKSRPSRIERETQLDPERTSSRLTPRGTTREEDE